MKSPAASSGQRLQQRAPGIGISEGIGALPEIHKKGADAGASREARRKPGAARLR
jgi:hypothetical protein